MEVPIIPEKLVDSAEQIEIWLEHREDEESTLAISVKGTVESTNWTNPRLHYIDSQEAPPRGIHPFDVYEFEFYATPPQVGDVYSMHPTPITTVFKWPGYSKDMKLIRVRTTNNMASLKVDLGGAGTPFEEETAPPPAEQETYPQEEQYPIDNEPTIQKSEDDYLG